MRWLFNNVAPGRFIKLNLELFVGPCRRLRCSAVSVPSRHGVFFGVNDVKSRVIFVGTQIPSVLVLGVVNIYTKINVCSTLWGLTFYYDYLQVAANNINDIVHDLFWAF